MSEEILLSARGAIAGGLARNHRVYVGNETTPTSVDGYAEIATILSLIQAGDIPSLAAVYAALDHEHEIGGVTGLQDALDALGDAISAAVAGGYPLVGNPSGFLTAVPDLSSVYSVLAHTHPVPPIVNLTDAPTVAINAALRGPFRLTIGGNRILGNPTNLVDGQIFTVEIVQTSGGHTLALDTKYHVGPDVANTTLSVAAGARDKATFQYNQTVDLIDVLAFVHL